MDTQFSQVVFPKELIEEVDATVGAALRNSFLADSARVALDRRRGLLEFLRSDEPVWKDEAHPELVELGTEGWVRALRQESQRRLERLQATERAED